MNGERFDCIFSMARCGKTIRIQQEYEKVKADGKKVLLVDEEQLEKELMGADYEYWRIETEVYS